MLGLPREIKKILILADDNAVMTLCIAANFSIQRMGQTDIEDMLTIKAALLQILRKGRWQLIINQEFHEVRSTTWSV